MAPLPPRYLEPLDLNADGHEDLAVFSTDSLAFIFNDGNNGFLPGPFFSYDGIAYDFGDLAGNGFPDLVAINTAGDIFWYPNFGNEDIGGPFTLITGAEQSGRNDIALADMDGDGDLDVLTCSATGAAAWLGNDGMLPTALPSSTHGTSLTLFPNPVHDEARLVMPTPIGSDTRVQLIDASGRLLRTLYGNGSNTVLIERGHLESGLYVLRVMRAGERIGSARIVID